MVLLSIVRCLQYILLLLFCSSVLLLLFSCSVISDCDPMIHSTLGSLCFTISWSWLRLMSIQTVMASNHLILCCLLFFFPSIFPNIGVFTNESALPISGQKFGTSTSASVIPWTFKVDSFQEWLVWSPFYPGDSQESSPAPQFKSSNFSSLSLRYGPVFTSTHDPWENHSFH